MITKDQLAELHGMMPDAAEIDPIALVTIHDDIADEGKPHQVALCIAYGGYYFACLTCEAQGHYEENVPPGWSVSALAEYAQQRADQLGSLRLVVRNSELVLLDHRNEAVPAAALFEPPSAGEITDAAQDWHDEL